MGEALICAFGILQVCSLMVAAMASLQGCRIRPYVRSSSSTAASVFPEIYVQEVRHHAGHNPTVALLPNIVLWTYPPSTPKLPKHAQFHKPF